MRQDDLSACHLPDLSNSVLLSGKSGNSNNPMCTEMDDTLINTGIWNLCAYLPARQGTVEWYAFDVES